jgi:polyhydroxyalkanoate synthesis regulator phasin
MNEPDRRDSGREGLGILSTLKDALDEVIAEARDKGGLSADRARDAVRGAMARARDAAGEARERLDVVTHQELQDVRDALDELKVRLENLERRTPQDPMAGPSRPEGAGSGGVPGSESVGEAGGTSPAGGRGGL